jgi:hypothetical protein
MNYELRIFSRMIRLLKLQKALGASKFFPIETRASYSFCDGKNRLSRFGKQADWFCQR